MPFLKTLTHALKAALLAAVAASSVPAQAQTGKPIRMVHTAAAGSMSDTFTRVVAPLMLPAIATCAIFNFVNFDGRLYSLRTFSSHWRRWKWRSCRRTGRWLLWLEWCFLCELLDPSNVVEFSLCQLSWCCRLLGIRRMNWLNFSREIVAHPSLERRLFEGRLGISAGCCT